MSSLDGFPRRKRPAHQRTAGNAWTAVSKRTHEPPPGEATREALDIARYVADMTAQLEAMSTAVDLDLLAYFLAMAKAEAELFLRMNAEAAPTPEPSDDEDVAGAGGATRGGGAGVDYAEDWNGNGVLDGVEGQGAGGVAGDDEELGALFTDQELGALCGVAGDGAAGLGAVGETGGVAEEGKPGAGETLDECAEDGEAAEAGIEDADGGGS